MKRIILIGILILAFVSGIKAQFVNNQTISSRTTLFKPLGGLQLGDSGAVIPNLDTLLGRQINYYDGTSGKGSGFVFLNGKCFYRYNGAWVELGLASSSGVTSFNSRTGAISPIVSDYNSFYPLLTTQMIAGYGLTGGGTLSANRTFTLDSATVFANFLARNNSFSGNNNFQNRPTYLGSGLIAASDTLAMLNARLSSISLTTSGVLYATPVTFNRVGGAWTGTLSLNTQIANTIFAGPTTGSAATPTFRALVAADIPTTLTAYIQNQNGATLAAQTAKFWVSDTIKTSGAGIFGSVVIPTATQNRIFFANATGVLTQDAANLSWDDGNNFFGVRTNSPGYMISGGDGTGIGAQWISNYGNTANILMGQAGGTYFGKSIGTTAFIVQDNARNFDLLIGNANSKAVLFGTAGVDRGGFDLSGHFRPSVTNTYTNGTSSLRWSNVYGVLGDFSGIITTSAGISVGTNAAIGTSATIGTSLTVGTTAEVTGSFTWAKGSAQYMWGYLGTTRFAWSGLNTNYIYSGGSGGLIIGNQADNAALVTVTNTGVTTLIEKFKPAAGSTTVTPLQFTSGALNTTPLAGGLEFLTDKYYATITTGAARKEIGLIEGSPVSGQVAYYTTNNRFTGATNFLFDGTKLTVGIATKGTGSVADASILGIQSVNSTSDAAIFHLGQYAYAEQTAATTASIQALEGQAFTSHASGTVALAIGTIGNVQVNSASAVTEIRALQAGGNTNAAAPIAVWRNVYSQFSNSGAATITDGYLLWTGTFPSGVTNKYNIYTSDATAINYFSGTNTLATTPSTSAGTYDFLTRNTSTGVIEKMSGTPSLGAFGYWSRSGTTLSPTTSGDAITTTGAVSGLNFNVSTSLSSAGASGRIYKSNSFGLGIYGITGSVYDFSLLNASGTAVISNTTGTTNVVFGGDISLVNITATGTATLTSAPTTSAGTYDILTRNTSTGVVEKITSNFVTTSEVTGTSQSAAVQNRYIANNASLITVTLPASANIGDVIYINGKGAGKFKVAQNSGQFVHYGASTTTTGTGGSITAQDQYGCIEIRCITAGGTEWSIVNSSGAYTII
jgi:hypothetical protein